MKPITERQAEYIELMLTNRFATDHDRDTVTSHLKQVGKKDVSEMTVSEASSLIGTLLERAVEYELLCGRKLTMSRQEGHRLDLFGEHEACSHHCPVGIYFPECEHFQAYDDEIHNSRGRVSS